MCLINETSSQEDVRRSAELASLLLILALDGTNGQFHVLAALNVHWIRGSIGFQFRSVCSGEEKILYLHRESNCGHSVRRLTELSRLQLLIL